MQQGFTSVFRICVVLLIAVTSQLGAQIAPDRSVGIGQKEFRISELEINNLAQFPAALPSQVSAQAAAELAALGVPAGKGRLDVRGQRWETLILSLPLLPGRGSGNNLRWPDGPPSNEAALRQAAWNALNGYLQSHQAQLRINQNELARPGKVTVHSDGTRIQIHGPRVIDGIPVRGSYLSASINHGNMVLFGAHKWGEVNVSTTPRLSQEAALAEVVAYANPYTMSGSWGKSELIIVPLARGNSLPDVALGEGYDYRLAWAIRSSFNGDMGGWEALVDAHSGQLLSFEDTNEYAQEVKGGVLPVSNDGVPPDGVEQAGWPMPFDIVSTNVGLVATDAGGNLLISVSGDITSELSGQYVHINDNCGAISLTSSGDVIDFGTSAGTDCTTPGFGGAGNTHSARTGFHELNRIIESAKGQLPTNSWLQGTLTANMNINATCNAFWNGTVNFYRSGGGCFNTGEIAGVFDHEWGHGMDANDATPGIAGPSGEGIADIYTALRLNDSCIGRNFRSTVCGGFGDPCTTCTGVRDIDFLKRASGQPHTYTWSNANCGGSVHCVGGVYSEAVWSLWKNELMSAPYNLDNNTAMEVVTRLTYIGAGGVGTWFSGGPPYGGCSSTGGYLNFLAADDDDGDLSNGTPHMAAIFAAFDRQEIACQTPTVQESGCAGAPTAAPIVTATPSDKSVTLSWGAVADAAKYQIFQTDGVFACDFGKTKVGETVGTSFTAEGLQNGRQYSYVVIPVGGSDACMGPASSCTSGSPAPGPNVDVDASSAIVSLDTGDSDEFVDNCEQGQMTFDVSNTGLGTLNNVRIVGVTPISHPETTVLTSFPAPISSPTLAEGETGLGGFDFTAGGLAFNDTLVFQVEVTADELPASRVGDLLIHSTESDIQFEASRTFSFESDAENWQVVQGTFNRSSSGGGAGGTSWYEASSANLNNQCDQVRSPVMSLTATSTLSLSNQFDIEPQYTNGVWYDRANVGIREVVSGSRTAVSPDSGRLYNASGAQGTCGTTGQQGWADTAAAWDTSTWSATALGSAGFAGQLIQLDISYGTDASLNGTGFHFDEVTVTDVEFVGPDTQSDDCSTSGCTLDSECDDGAFCNGAETCNVGSGICQAATPPSCDDGVSCTDDSCNEATGSCDNVANDSYCDNGEFCDGAETCDSDLDCQSGTDPCPGMSCDEVADDCTGACDFDGVCEVGEDCDTCPADCVGGEIPTAVCGNGICEAGDGEDCVTCAADCNGKQNGKPANRFCCGAGGGQNPVSCGDAICSTGGWSCTDDPQPAGGDYCCGDLVCEPGYEDSFSCDLDCDPVPVFCEDITARKDCNSEPGCSWDNRAKVCGPSI